MHLIRAYLDAGSGSMILQVIVGGFAAVAVSMKLFWRRILNFLHIRKPDEEHEDETTAPSTATTSATQAESRDSEPATTR